MAGRRRRVDEIPAGQCAIIGANIRTLRHRKGWTQAQLGELMGWHTNSTVCAAEGHRDGRQRGVHHRRDRATGRHLRHPGMAAHDTVRELRGTPASRVLLPHLRSTPRRTFS